METVVKIPCRTAGPADVASVSPVVVVLVDCVWVVVVEIEVLELAVSVVDVETLVVVTDVEVLWLVLELWLTVVEEEVVVTDVEVLELNAEHGEHNDIPLVAIIDEDICIGCTLCIQACPVDAILGAAKHMHTVIADECTGCKLCIPPCPVDCIDMVPVKQTIDDWKWTEPVLTREYADGV